MRHLNQTFHCLAAQRLKCCEVAKLGALCCERASDAHSPVLVIGSCQRQRPALWAFQRELSLKAPAARGAAAESRSRRRRPTRYGTCYRMVWYGIPTRYGTCYTSAHNGARPPTRPPTRLPAQARGATRTRASCTRAPCTETAARFGRLRRATASRSAARASFSALSSVFRRLCRRTIAPRSLARHPARACRPLTG